MRKWTIRILIVLVVASGIFWATADQDLRGLILHMPTDRDVLFWSISQRDCRFSRNGPDAYYYQIPDHLLR